jgi:uncharacterized protein (DUF362 family)
MPSVSLIRAHSYDVDTLRQQLETLLEPLGGIQQFVKPGDRVLLKPNLLTGARPTQECTTRPEIVYCVAQMVKAAGGHPFLGDSPAFGSARGVAKANGLLSWAQKLDLPIIELHGKRYETDDDQFGSLRLSEEAMEADVLINLPKVKSHMQLTMTLGVKNLFGCVPGKMKAWWHMEAGKDRQRFGRMLVQTASLLAPELTLVDGIIGHEGNGPSGGDPRDLGLLAASPDVFALDLALLAVLQVPADTVPTVVESRRLGLCPELSEITFPYLSPQTCQVEAWRLPETLVPIDFGMPRVVKSTFRHLYIRFIKEPLTAYAGRL